MDLLIPGGGLFIWTLVSLFALVLPVVALFSVLRSSFKDSTVKLTWVFVIILVPIAGPIFYFVLGRKQRVTAA